MNMSHESAPYTEHMMRTHRRLRELTRELRGVCREIDAASLAAEARLTSGLQQLLEELRRHFAQEEEGGCLEQAVTRCPSLAEEARSVCREHPELLARLERLVEILQVQGIRGAGAWEPLFAEFAEALEAHEVREERILAEVYGFSPEAEAPLPSSPANPK